MNVKALYRRAQAYTSMMDLDLAEQDIKKALEIDPENRHVVVSFSIAVEIFNFINFVRIKLAFFPRRFSKSSWWKKFPLSRYCR